MRVDIGRENTLDIHITLLPYISSTSEIKTKPTQHSVAELRGIGIQPDIIVAVRPRKTTRELRSPLFCDVEKRGVIPLVTTPVIYEVPLVLEEAGLGDFLVERLGNRLQQSQSLDDEVAQTGLLEDEGHLIDAGHGTERDDSPLLDIAEEGDLVLESSCVIA